MWKWRTSPSLYLEPKLSLSCSLLFCPNLTKGSKWQITKIWENCIFRLDLAYSTSNLSLEQKHSSCWKIFKSRHNDIALMSMYRTDTFCSFTRNVIFKSCFFLSEYGRFPLHFLLISPSLSLWICSLSFLYLPLPSFLIPSHLSISFLISPFLSLFLPLILFTLVISPIFLSLYLSMYLNITGLCGGLGRIRKYQTLILTDLSF